MAVTALGSRGPFPKAVEQFVGPMPDDLTSGATSSLTCDLVPIDDTMNFEQLQLVRAYSVAKYYDIGCVRARAWNNKPVVSVKVRDLSDFLRPRVLRRSPDIGHLTVGCHIQPKLFQRLAP